ncbi:MAG: alpha/beta hydrolase [Casimicrobiaceae bacterium]
MRKAEFTSLSAHGFHPVTYYDWGDPANPQVVICVHGLTRNGRDFDVLAAALAPTHRVLAIDMPGRGESAWLRDPMDYGFATYVTTLTALIARSGAGQVDWVGTSMGGLLGMVLAGQPGTPIARLVINDIGPAIELAALTRIGGYLGRDPTFTTYDEAEAYIRTVSAPFGALEDAHWEALTRSSVREGPDGSWTLRYDPGIAVPFRANPVPADLWPAWDAIQVPTLVLRGRESDLLSHATAVAMTQRGARARLVEFAAVGHAPALLTPDQIEPIVDFLR